MATHSSSTEKDGTVDSGDFYTDLRYCAHCQQYVPYLRSLQASYCTRCDQPVTVFSPDDRAAIQREPGWRERDDDGAAA